MGSYALTNHTVVLSSWWFFFKMFLSHRLLLHEFWPCPPINETVTAMLNRSPMTLPFRLFFIRIYWLIIWLCIFSFFYVLKMLIYRPSWLATRCHCKLPIDWWIISLVIFIMHAFLRRPIVENIFQVIINIYVYIAYVVIWNRTVLAVALSMIGVGNASAEDGSSIAIICDCFWIRITLSHFIFFRPRRLFLRVGYWTNLISLFKLIWITWLINNHWCIFLIYWEFAQFIVIFATSRGVNAAFFPANTLCGIGILSLFV